MRLQIVIIVFFTIAYSACQAASTPSGSGPATALLANGDCEAAGSTFLELAAPPGPLAEEGARIAFGRPCSVENATGHPRSLTAVALAKSGQRAEAAALFEELAKAGDFPAALMSLDFSLAGNTTAPNPAPPPGLVQARADYNAKRYGQAMPVIQGFAEQGDPVACYLLGDYLRSERFGKTNETQAVTWYERAAAKGHARAMVTFSYYLDTGKIIPRDHERSMALLRQAMVQGEGEAYFEMSRRLAKDSPGHFHPLALYYLGQSAHQGDIFGMYVLGLYLERSPYPDIQAKGVSWLVRAAEKGFPDACIRLAEMYESGQTVSKDYAKAAFWYRQGAATRYEANAMYRLALLYRDGRGVPRDLAEAAFWAHLAARFGHEEATRLAQDLAARLLPDALAEARQRAEKWTPPPSGPWVRR